jgi:hypothetical protein
MNGGVRGCVYAVVPLSVFRLLPNFAGMINELLL